MKLFINDTVFPKGHSLLNNRLLSYLGDQDLLIANHQGYYNPQSYNNLEFLEVPYKTEGCPKFKHRMMASFESAKTILRNYSNFDKIIYFTFDTLTFALERPFIGAKATYLFHHKNTSELSNPKYKFAFKMYANTVHHIVLSEFIADFLISEIGVNSNLVHTLPHPLLNQSLTSADKDPIKKKSNNVWIGLGLSNDEKLISQIVEYEKSTGILKNNDIQLILRSSNHSHHVDNIEIISDYLSPKRYNSLYDKCKGVLLLYPQTYKNRFSGSIMDAIGHNKPVIGTNIQIVNEFANYYPSYCNSFENVKGMFDIIIKMGRGDIQLNYSERENFLNIHSDREIKERLYKILND